MMSLSHALSRAAVTPIPSCKKCITTNKAYHECTWIIVFQALHANQGTFDKKTTVGTAPYMDPRQIYDQRHRTTKLGIKVEADGPIVFWTLTAQDDLQPDTPCSNAHVVIDCQYEMPSDQVTGQVIINTLRHIWNQICDLREDGTAWLQRDRREAKMHYRIIIIIGRHMRQHSHYGTIVRVVLTPEGPTSEWREDHDLTRRLVPNATEVTRPHGTRQNTVP